LRWTALLHKKQGVTLCKGIEVVKKFDERNCSLLNNVKESERRSKSEVTIILVEKVDHHDGGDAFDYVSRECGKKKKRIGKNAKHKRSHRHEVDLDAHYSNDSKIKTRKEAKRRRKEEKKLRKRRTRRNLKGKKKKPRRS